MRTYLECMPCFLRHSLEVSHLVTDDTGTQEKIMKAILKLLSQVELDQAPPLTTAKIHRLIRELTGERDPYKRLKQTFNQVASNLYPEMKIKVKESTDPFGAAVRLAIAGNAIDCIQVTELDLREIQESVRNSLDSTLDESAVSLLRNSIAKAESILYIADNAGELVFDRLLLEEMPSDKVTLAVRGSPILNDATMEDADASLVAELVDVIDTGSDAPGVILEECSGSFRDCFESADLVLSKGQGNYETLSQCPKAICFLFRVKCPVVARNAGYEVGTPMVLCSARGQA